MWCCCNVPPELVHKQNHLPFENMKHTDYDRTDTTGWSTTEARGERSMMTFYYYIFFWMIFDLYKQEPIWASTAGDRGSVPVTLCSYMYWYPSTGFLVKSVFVKWQVAPCNGIRIPESVKFLLLESGLLGYGIWSTSQGIRDPTKDQGHPTSIFEKYLFERRFEI